MADVEVEQSQPASNASDIMRKTFANYAPEETPQAPDASAPQEVETFDPATIKIPNRQFATNVPKSFEKFKDKTLVDFANSYEEAEKGFHSKAKEAADARRENEELRQRLAAAEQFGRMTRQPEVQAPHDPYRGLNPDEAIITNPRAVLDATLTESDRRAEAIAERKFRESEARTFAAQKEQREATELIAAFELARGEVSKLQGRDVSIEEWQNDLQDIARVVHAREPERKFDHNAYVETYTRLRGVPKVSVPQEGNAPIASKPATVQNERAPNTLSREDAQLNRQIRKALGLEK